MPKRAVIGDVKVAPLNMRTTPQLRKLLEKASRESGRSLTREVEHRLELSFERESIVLELARAMVAQARRL